MIMRPTMAKQDRCQFKGYACKSGLAAVHRIDGRDLCAYHSPFDVIEGEFDMDVRHDPEWIVPYARNNDECPNCGGTIAPNGDRYSSESPRALICGGCELVYA
jgi:hypothetical protein